MDTNLPLKRLKRETEELFIFKKIDYNKTLRQYVCCLSAKGYPKPLYIPLENLPEDTKQKIRGFSKGQNIPLSKPQTLPSTKNVEKKIEKEKIIKPKNDKESSKSKLDSFLRRICEVYKKGNYLIDRPVKIIGVHGIDSLMFSVLFNCSKEIKNVGTIPYSVVIEKYPDLLIDFLLKSRVVLSNKSVQDINFN
ncbi:hypothetical protein SteCoe_7171 [Stentor coeruleus]|uniref:Uncharacterized protein n=1 Tax=Stentor coeruleus TaxID=5963 RepID=A0A1R2CN78_9CILI|nr:hypothetical protein SteCoe_7171 [Stentor coeruleus]